MNTIYISGKVAWRSATPKIVDKGRKKMRPVALFTFLLQIDDLPKNIRPIRVSCANQVAQDANEKIQVGMEVIVVGKLTRQNTIPEEENEIWALSCKEFFIHHQTVASRKVINVDGIEEYEDIFPEELEGII